MQRFDIKEEADIVRARSAARDLAGELGFSIVNKTRVATAVSELARNTLEHGLGGHMELEQLSADGRVGLRCIFVDEGPGIADVDQALTDGFTTCDGHSLGQGLPGAKRLVDTLEIISRPGDGTRVELVKWL